jgi:lysozyme
MFSLLLLLTGAFCVASATRPVQLLQVEVNAEALRLAVPPSTNCESATDLIMAAEGLRLCTYVDTTGHKTICYGFNLETAGAEAAVQAVGGNWDSVYNHGGCLTNQQCVQLLTPAVNSAARSEASIFGPTCDCISAVLTDMTYNLGASGMASFTQFVGLIKAKQWASAATDAAHTLWCTQVGNRCTRDCGIIRAGCPGQ